tara:strand:- start:1803 stop:2018 length:216 start_codon:yes stop_codon:yes gene_type:complete
MANIVLTFRNPLADNESMMGGDASTVMCATFLGGLVPTGGCVKVGLGDLKIGDKFRYPDEEGPEVEVISRN